MKRKAILVLNAGSSSLKFLLFAEQGNDAGAAGPWTDRSDPHVAAFHRAHVAAHGCGKVLGRRRRARSRRSRGASRGVRPRVRERVRARGRGTSGRTRRAGLCAAGCAGPRCAGLAGASSFRWRRCTSRTTWRRSERCSHGAPICRRWRVSIRRSIPPIRMSPSASPYRPNCTTRACAATDSTDSPTSTSPRSWRSTTSVRLRAGPSCAIWAMARACARCEAGRSIASTMGFTALDGLAMGTRSGALDPGVLLYLMDRARDGRARDREAALHAVGLVGRIRRVERHAETPRLERSPGEAGRRSLRLSHPARAGFAGGRAGRSGRAGLHRRHRRKQRRRFESACAAMPPGSA